MLVSSSLGSWPRAGLAGEGAVPEEHRPPPPPLPGLPPPAAEKQKPGAAAGPSSPPSPSSLPSPAKATPRGGRTHHQPVPGAGAGQSPQHGGPGIRGSIPDGCGEPRGAAGARCRRLHPTLRPPSPAEPPPRPGTGSRCSAVGAEPPAPSRGTGGTERPQSSVGRGRHLPSGPPAPPGVPARPYLGTGASPRCHLPGHMVPPAPGARAAPAAAAPPGATPGAGSSAVGRF